MKILVTGSSGFIGKEVLKRLCAQGAEVHAVSHHTSVSNSGAACQLFPTPLHIQNHRANLLKKADVTSLLARVSQLTWFISLRAQSLENFGIFLKTVNGKKLLRDFLIRSSYTAAPRAQRTTFVS